MEVAALGAVSTGGLPAVQILFVAAGSQSRRGERTMKRFNRARAYDFMLRYQEEHGGLGASLREIAADQRSAGFTTSVFAAREGIRGLIEDGFVRRRPGFGHRCYQAIPHMATWPLRDAVTGVRQLMDGSWAFEIDGGVGAPAWAP